MSLSINYHSTTDQTRDFRLTRLSKVLMIFKSKSYNFTHRPASQLYSVSSEYVTSSAEVDLLILYIRENFSRLGLKNTA